MTFWFLNKCFVKVITRRSSEGFGPVLKLQWYTLFFFNYLYLETLKYTTPSCLGFRHALILQFTRFVNNFTKFVCCVEISVVFEISVVVCGLFFVYFSGFKRR